MGDAGGKFTDPTGQHDTSRVARAAAAAVHDEFEPLAKRLGNIRTILSAIAALVVIGFLAAVYLSRFATAAALKEHTAAADMATGSVVKRVEALEVDRAVDRAANAEWRKHVDEDLGYVVDQVRAIANSPHVRARVLEPPKHLHKETNP